jgi:hypothetical protein
MNCQLKYLVKISFVIFLAVSINACNYVTYTPRSAKNKLAEKPTALLFDRIIDFRVEYNSWPVSKEDFISKGNKYKDAFKDSPYLTVEFKRKDSNNMTLYYTDHLKDVETNKRTNKTELNSYRGSVKFYKEHDRFLWKSK